MWALEQGMCAPAVFRALPCGLSPPLDSLEGAGSRFTAEDPKEKTGHLRKAR